MRVEGWSYLRWGVVFVTPEATTARFRVSLIGSLWHDVARNTSYPGEPTRALVFQRRHQARAWCAAENAKYCAYPVGNVCRKWRMRVVRVRETVTVVR